MGWQKKYFFCWMTIIFPWTSKVVDYKQTNVYRSFTMRIFRFMFLNNHCKSVRGTSYNKRIAHFLLIPKIACCHKEKSSVYEPSELRTVKRTLWMGPDTAEMKHPNARWRTWGRYTITLSQMRKWNMEMYCYRKNLGRVLGVYPRCETESINYWGIEAK